MNFPHRPIPDTRHPEGALGIKQPLVLCTSSFVHRDLEHPAMQAVWGMNKDYAALLCSVVGSSSLPRKKLGIWLSVLLGRCPLEF